VGTCAEIQRVLGEVQEKTDSSLEAFLSTDLLEEGNGREA